MSPDEKDRLLALFDHESRWCQEAEARDAEGEPVHFDSEDAVAWDLVGALCRLFGWARATELFGQIARHVLRRINRCSPFGSPISAMAALVDFNDDPQLDFAILLAKLQILPVTGRQGPLPPALGTA
jgi:hypothetical protein